MFKAIRYVFWTKAATLVFVLREDLLDRLQHVFWTKAATLVFVLREDFLDRLQRFCDDRAAANDIYV
jgi:hypothetical protein